jgi:hypothetical protein
MRVRPLLTFGALLVLGGAPALAGRAVTDDERAKTGVSGLCPRMFRRQDGVRRREI